MVNEKALMLTPKIIDKKPKEIREEQRRKTRLLKNRFINELDREAEDLPEEKILKKNLKNFYDADQEEREEMEETYFVRHQPTKKEKKIIKDKLRKSEHREGLGDFTDLNQLKGIFGQEEQPQTSKNQGGKASGPRKHKGKALKKFRK